MTLTIRAGQPMEFSMLRPAFNGTKSTTVRAVDTASRTPLTSTGIIGINRRTALQTNDILDSPAAPRDAKTIQYSRAQPASYCRERSCPQQSVEVLASQLAFLSALLCLNKDTNHFRLSIVRDRGSNCQDTVRCLPSFIFNSILLLAQQQIESIRSVVHFHKQQQRWVRLLQGKRRQLVTATYPAFLKNDKGVVRGRGPPVIGSNCFAAATANSSSTIFVTRSNTKTRIAAAIMSRSRYVSSSHKDANPSSLH